LLRKRIPKHGDVDGVPLALLVEEALPVEVVLDHFRSFFVHWRGVRSQPFQVAHGFIEALLVGSQLFRLKNSD
jgi:hypothetical protein